MFVDPAQVITDMDGKPVMLDQVMDLPAKARVATVAGGASVFVSEFGEILFGGAPAPMKGGVALTFGMLACKLLCASFKGEEELPAEKKLERGLLGLKLKEAALPVDLKSEELALIKSLAGKGCDIPTFIRVADICDNPRPLKHANGSVEVVEHAASS